MSEAEEIETFDKGQSLAFRALLTVMVRELTKAGGARFLAHLRRDTLIELEELMALQARCRGASPAEIAGLEGGAGLTLHRILRPSEGVPIRHIA